MNKALLGLFTYADNLIAAAEKLKSAGFGITIFSPVPLDHELEHAFGERKNYIKYFTLAGAIAGFLGGTILAIGTAIIHILPRGGRAIAPLTPTVIISYETSILIGVLFTIAGFFIMARLPSFRKKIYDPKISVDSFGLLVEDIAGERIDEVKKIMSEQGADQVKNVEKN